MTTRPLTPTAARPEEPDDAFSLEGTDYIRHWSKPTEREQGIAAGLIASTVVVVGAYWLGGFTFGSGVLLVVFAVWGLCWWAVRMSGEGES
jgi:hypothetical protein